MTPLILEISPSPPSAGRDAHWFHVDAGTLVVFAVIIAVAAFAISTRKARRANKRRRWEE